MSKTTARWIVAVLLAITFVGSGLPKLMGAAGMGARFEAWGYPAAFSYVVGLAELAGGILVLVPRFARGGSLLLSLVMAGAVFTHLRTGIGSPTFAAALLVMSAALVWLTRPTRVDGRTP